MADDWSEICKDDLELAAATLEALADEDQWPVARWRVALQDLAGRGLIGSVMGPCVAALFMRAPERDHRRTRTATESVAAKRRQDSGHERGRASSRFVGGRLEQSTPSDEIEDDDEDPVFYALNHPEGHVVEGLVRWLTKESPYKTARNCPMSSAGSSRPFAIRRTTTSDMVVFGSQPTPSCCSGLIAFGP